MRFARFLRLALLPRRQASRVAETASVPLLLRHLELILPPDQLDPLDVHLSAAVVNQAGDLTVAVAAILAR